MDLAVARQGDVELAQGALVPTDSHAKGGLDWVVGGIYFELMFTLLALFAPASSVVVVVVVVVDVDSGVVAE